MSEHTEGEWKALFDLDNEQPLIVRPNADGSSRVIATVNTQGKSAREVIANAHLIAKAWTIPMLREALEEVAGLAIQMTHTMDDDCPACRVASIVDRALATQDDPA